MTTGVELAAMNNADFAAFIRESGIKTVSEITPEPDDADIIPDETPPLPPDEPVKTDPIPEEAP